MILVSIKTIKLSLDKITIPKIQSNCASLGAGRNIETVRYFISFRGTEAFKFEWGTT